MSVRLDGTVQAGEGQNVSVAGMRGSNVFDFLREQAGAGLKKQFRTDRPCNLGCGSRMILL